MFPLSSLPIDQMILALFGKGKDKVYEYGMSSGNSRFEIKCRFREPQKNL
jgi:hypothetical protein